jgi:hypothetical protein
MPSPQKEWSAADVMAVDQVARASRAWSSDGGLHCDCEDDCDHED